MKIVVIGGTGLIGSKTVAILRQRGHDVVAASPNTGVNTITGEGLKEALAGAEVVIDLANSPSFEDKAVLEFFQTSEHNLLRGRGRSGRPAPRGAIHRRNRPDRQWLFPRQGRPRGTDQSLPHPLHHRPLDPVPGISPRHRRLQARMETQSEFRPSCSSLLRRTKLPPPSPRRRSRRRETASSRSPARNERRSTKSSPLSEGGRRPA